MDGGGNHYQTVATVSGTISNETVKMAYSKLRGSINDEMAAVLPELAKTADFKGVTGTISFDNFGDLKDGAMTLYTYKGGKKTKMEVVR